MRRFMLAAATCLLLLNAHAADEYAKPSSASGARYTFTWPLDAAAPKPRGGTTKGPPVELDTSPSVEWKALREQGLSAFEKDRRAILAMAGTYRVTFDFLEIVSYATPRELIAPYQSWATEKIYVDEDRGKFISLVHILEMRIVQQDGSISEPMVTKHWRQDWLYEPTHIVEYHGHERWTRRALSKEEGKGVWAQTVYQVDESPRYGSLGRWQHNASFSSWISGDTWRPLPRREWSVRDDYDVLVGTNRHTIYPTGWIQEENNLKVALAGEGTPDDSKPFLAREYGVARYERIRDNDFSAADQYYEGTNVFWNQVRVRWAELFAAKGTVKLKGPVDKLGLFHPLFAHADAILENEATAQNEAVIDAALRDMGAL